MSKALESYVRYMGAFNTRLGNILGYGILVLIAIMLYESVARYAFNSPTVWSIELTKFIFGGYFLLGGAYTLLREKHVGMDIFYSRWSPRKRAIVNVVTFALLAIYLITWVWHGIENTEFALRTNFHSRSLWGPPLAPIRAVVTAGAALLLLQAIAMLFKDILTLRGKPA